MTMPCYKNGESLMMAACYKSSNNDDKSDNNEDKVCLLSKKIRFGESCVKSHARSYARLHARSYDHRSCNNGVIIHFI